MSEYNRKLLSQEFFKEQVERLKKNYGAEAYPDESVKALWFNLKHITEGRFFAAVNRILAVYVHPKYPPGLDKIEKALAEIREENWGEQKIQINNQARNMGKTKSLSGKQVTKEIGEILKNIK